MERWHIQQLKNHKARGHVVVVWSQGGADWARKVVEELGLVEYVDVTIAKPMWYYDDIDSTLFMGKRTYLEPGWEPE